LFGPGDQSSPSGQSRPNTHLPSPVSVSRIHLSSPCGYPSQVCVDSLGAARVAYPAVSLHGAVLFSSPRKGVQSAWIVGIRNAPPPLMPEKATSSSVRSAAISRPQIPQRLLVPRAHEVSGSPMHTCPLGIPADDWSVLVHASLAELLVPGSSGGYAAGLTQSRWLVSAGPVFTRTPHRTTGSRWWCFFSMCLEVWSPPSVYLLSGEEVQRSPLYKLLPRTGPPWLCPGRTGPA
jgi:hypothetical protein